MQIPRMRATARPLMDSPPKIAIASMVTRVETEVFTVRVSVALSARLVFSLRSALGCMSLYSRIRSKMTTLSLIA